MRSPWFAIGLAPLIIVGILFPALIGRCRLAFRDVSHFYEPTYAEIGRRCAVDVVPLWNPLDATGMPMLGETTTAVLYPPRYVIWSLPIPSHVAMAWYIALHLSFASLAATVAAVGWGVRRRIASIAGISYALSGSVLYLYTNPPFLVSAAWLPLAVWAMSARRPWIAGASMAMMVLGGDPQTALHAVLVALLLIRGWIDVRTIACAGAAAAVLAAPQLAASLDWSAQSDRATIPAAEAYGFSLPPWHFAELLTSHPFGSLLPRYQRWSSLIPGDGRVWTPSIFLGSLLPIVLAVRLFRRRPVLDRGLVMLLVGGVAASGHFGLAWWGQQIGWVGAETPSATGGLYWFLREALPGYDAFRYPAKWLPVLSLGGALLIAKTVDDESLRLGRSHLLGLVGIGVPFAGWCALRVGTSMNQPVDPFWGPLDLQSGLRETAISIAVSFAAVTALLVAVTKIRSDGLVFVLVAAEMAWFASSIVAMVDVETERQRVQSIAPEIDWTPTRILRTQTAPAWPHVWSQTRSDDRLADVEAVQRASLFARWHHANRWPMFNSMVSIRGGTMAAFWQSVMTATPVERTELWRLARERFAIDTNVNVGNTPFRVRAIRLENRTAAKVDPRRIRRPVLQDGHWLAEYFDSASESWKTVRVHPDGLAQFVDVPRSATRVRFSYAPWWLVPTATVSLIAWCALAVVGLRRRSRSRVDGPAHSAGSESMVSV